MTAAIVVRVVIEATRTGLLVARSKDLPGFLFTGKTSQQIRSGIPGVIKAMLEDAYSTEVEVISAQIGDIANDMHPAWVAFPALQSA